VSIGQSEVQTICHYHFVLPCCLVLAYLGCPRKEAVNLYKHCFYMFYGFGKKVSPEDFLSSGLAFQCEILHHRHTSYMSTF